MCIELVGTTAALFTMLKLNSSSALDMCSALLYVVGKSLDEKIMGI